MDRFASAQQNLLGRIQAERTESVDRSDLKHWFRPNLSTRGNCQGVNDCKKLASSYITKGPMLVQKLENFFRNILDAFKDGCTATRLASSCNLRTSSFGCNGGIIYEKNHRSPVSA